MRSSFARTRLIAILLAYLILAVFFAVYTPAWQAPDEPAHYNYVRYLAEQGQFPVLHMGDYPHAYLEQIKAAGFPPGMSVDPIRYEFHQPPLYYALLAPIHALAGGSLTALRLVSVLLGAGIVLLAYAIGRRAFPGRPAVALGATAFVAFLPQHLATVSQVGNDVLAELLLAMTLYLLLLRMANGEAAPPAKSAIRNPQSAILLGLLLGLILITKTTAYIALPLAAGVLVWRWWRERAGLRRILAEAAAVILPAVLIALPWYARNISVYGWPDLLGLQRHDAIVIGQTRLADFVAGQGWAAYWQRAVGWTFKSFVGVFGWMGVWLDTRVYFALALLGGMAVSGWLLRTTYSVLHTPYSVVFHAAGGATADENEVAVGGRQTADGRRRSAVGGRRSAVGGRRSADGRQQTADGRLRTADGGRRSAVGIFRADMAKELSRSTQYAIRSTQYATRLLAFSALLTFLAYAWYNTQFLQHQGRYLFTALIPIGLAFAAGWERVVRPGAGRWVAAGLVAVAGGLAAWGVTVGPGLPKWPVAMAAAAAVGAFLLDVGLTLLACRDKQGQRSAGRAFDLLHAAASAFPYAFLAIVALYALFGAIVPQLAQ